MISKSDDLGNGRSVGRELERDPRLWDRLGQCAAAPTCAYKCRHEHSPCGAQGPAVNNHKGYLCSLPVGHHGPHVACVRSDLSGMFHGLQRWVEGGKVVA